MFEIILWGIIFVISLVVLIKASDYFTDSAGEIGLFFKLSPFIVGVTIVALGTSLPELVSSVIAVLKGYSEIVAGNVVGSSITNIFLILGVIAIASSKNKFSHNIIDVDLLALFGSTFLIVMAMIDGKFTFFEGALCILGFGVFLYHTIFSRQVNIIDKFKIKKSIKENLQAKDNNKFPFKSLLLLVASSIFIFLGAKYVIDSVVYFSNLIHIEKSIIAASIVALGTSLPELVVSWSAARKGNLEVAMGNILGSNIFNAFVVMGVSAMIGTLIISDSILFLGIPMLVIATFMYVFVIQDRKIKKWEGIFLLIFYVFYIGKLFGWF